ncbi:uncharacterized protein LOC110908458 [Helianthus annuus]|uniref:uncharacterized protein LOC110908458 n=1 Tax=Helianthus annuus TaxID=4232 RepID=UPI000B90360F|nr:uncharacterized protein LOC110908458 [Helianthus annuus]
MPYPDFDSADSLDNRLTLEELDYDKNKQKKEFDNHFSSLTDEQRLTKNMRLTVGGALHDVEQTKVFAQWLLDLGEGNIGGSNDGEAIIEIPDDLLIMDSNDPVSDLIDFVYPSIIQNFSVATFFQERAILAPTNEVVDEINDRLLSSFPGDENEYLSSDSLSHHRLVLKVGVPVMLLRNIDKRNGFCNGTRLRVLMLGSRVIEAEVISGSNMGKRTFIPRIALTPSDKKIPFKFKRRQFTIVVCFTMTINKSQGQSLSKVDLFLRQPVFSLGQLYVALSRVKSRDGLKLVIVDKDGKLMNTTLNVVYKDVFRDL